MTRSKKIFINSLHVAALLTCRFSQQISKAVDALTNYTTSKELELTEKDAAELLILAGAINRFSHSILDFKNVLHHYIKRNKKENLTHAQTASGDLGGIN
jgi:hypothetical protein